MKQHNKKLLTWLGIGGSIIIFILLIPILVLYNDSCRNFVINYAISRMQSEDLSVEVKGLNQDLTNIDKVNVKFTGNTVEIDKINLKRNGFFLAVDIAIDKVTYKAANELTDKNNKLGKNANTSNQNKENTITKQNAGTKAGEVAFDIRDTLFYVKQVKRFIKTLKVNELVIDNGKKKQKYQNLSFVSGSDQDTLSMKMSNMGFNLVLDWNKDVSLKGEFQNISEFSGNFVVDALLNKEQKYNAFIKNTDYNVSVEGTVKNNLDKVVISKGVFDYSGKKLGFWGDIVVSAKKANVSSKVSLSDFMDISKIPSDITQNFQNILIDTTVLLGDNDRIDAKANLSRDKKKLGSCSATLQGKKLTVNADVSWISIKGYRLKTLAVKSNDMKNYNVDINGEDFKTQASVTYEKKIVVQRASIEINGGRITLDKPFVLNEANLDAAGSFKFDSLKFFEKLFNIKGKMSGNIFKKNGKAVIDINVDKLIHKAGQIFNGKIFGSVDDLRIDISSAVLQGQTFKNLCFLKKKDKLSLKTELSSGASVNLDGSIISSKVSLSGVIKKKYNFLKIKSAEFDLKGRQYTAAVDVVEGKKIGHLNLMVSPKRIQMSAQNFSARGIGSLFNQVLPECHINGDFTLSPQGGFFVGSGKCKIEHLVSLKSVIDIDLKQNFQNLQVQSKLVSPKDNLMLEFSLPLSITKSLAFNLRDSSNISAVIKGIAYIENILEFPDGVDVSGKIKSDLKITGNMNNPKVFGTLEYDNAAILVADVVLKNGKIKFIGEGNKLVVDRAEFVDSYGKKAKITGSASISNQDGLNLVTDLFFNMDNFRLFDTDSMKMNVTGNGKMTGPLNDMLLSGDLKIPLCELVISEGSENDKYKDIHVVNDIFLNKQKKEEEEADFFRYDLNLDVLNLEVIGNIYNLKFKGKLHQGTYKRQATLSGKLDLTKGRLNLFGKRMIFEETKLEFLKEYPFDPKLNLHCSRILDSMKVMLDIKNKPGKRMKINLHSDPAYTPDIILAQMMFGKSIRELSVAEAAQLAHAIQSMSQDGYVFSILNTFQNIGLVDSISFSTDGNNSSSLYKNSQSSSGNKVNMRAGKYISDNVFISVNKKDQETTFDVDISVGSNTSIKANSLGEVGVSWKFRY